MLRHTRFLIVVLLLLGLVVPAYAALSATEATFWRAERRPNVLQSPENEKPYMEGRLLVQFEPGASAEERAEVHDRLGGHVVDEIEPLDIQVLEVSEEATSMVYAYQAEPVVSFAEPDYIARIAGWPDGPVLSGDAATAGADSTARTPNDPRFPEQWALLMIRAKEAWDITTGSPDVIVAIVDTGADANHEDLQGKLVAGYDFVNNDSDPMDDQGHGTHVAGTVAAATNNGIGIAGVAWDCKIMPVKALSSSGAGAHSWIANAVVWAADHGADVINMSLGGPYTSATLQQAVDYAWNRGVVIATAAGNDGYSNPTYPAAYEHTIGVSAATQSDQRASFSNYGDYVDVAAPGVSILSTTRNNTYQAWSGTSMASPHVAGQAALVKSLHPDWTNAQIRATIEQTAHDLNTPGWDAIFGWGRIDLYAALNTGPRPTATPTLRAATATPTIEPTPSDDVEQQLIDLINGARAELGLPPLRRDERLMQAARRHSTDMAANTFCDHAGTDGSTPTTRISDAGYPFIAAGEVIACGWQSASDALQAWKDSPPHWQILTSTNYADIGCGVRQATSGAPYWTCNLARSAGSPPPPPTSTPTATHAAPSATPTRTLTPTPVLSPTPTPTDPGAGTTVDITPVAPAVGWVVSNETGKNHWGDDDMYSGRHGGQVYYGAMQFDLSEIPRGARVNWARLTIVGQTREFVGDSGSWSVYLLASEIDANWSTHDYLDIRDATGEHLLLPILRNDDLQRDKPNVFNFDGSQASALEYRISASRRASFRIEGPTEGANNLFSWDSGYGPGSIGRPPQLKVNYTPGEGVPPPPTPTPPPTDVPGGVETITLTPEPGNAGWVGSHEPGINHWDDDDIYAGIYTANTYIGGIRFNLAPLPPNAELVEAELDLTGQTREYMQATGTWSIEILASSMDAGWPSHDYTDLSGAAAVGALQDLAEGDSTLEYDQLDVRRVNRLGFTGSQLGELSSRRGSTGYISVRATGPTTGNSNVFSWDSGRGQGALGAYPILRIRYRLAAVTVTPGPTATPTQPASDGRAARLVQAVNEKRQWWGLAPLAVSSELERAAQAHSDDLATHDLWSHTGSDASSPADRMRRAGYPLAAGDEALAANSSDVGLILDAWLSNPRHAAMLMNPDFIDIGGGHAFNPGSTYGDYWTVLVARPADGGGTPGEDEVRITPVAQDAGFVVSNEPTTNHFGDDDMYAGSYAGLLYLGGMQFDLSGVPSNAQVTGATLSLSGQTAEFRANTGTWAVHLLEPGADAGWSGHGYDDLAGAASLGIVGSPMGAADLGAGQLNVLMFGDSTVAYLRDRLTGDRKASFRINGPESGEQNVFSWDSGVPGEHGTGVAPVLTIRYRLP